MTQAFGTVCCWSFGPVYEGWSKKISWKERSNLCFRTDWFLLGWLWMEDGCCGGWWRFVFVCWTLGPHGVPQNCEQRFSSFFFWHLLLVKWSLIKHWNVCVCRWMELRSVSPCPSWLTLWEDYQQLQSKSVTMTAKSPCKLEFWRGIVKGSGWGSFQNRWSWRDWGPPKTRHSKRVRDWWHPPKLTWLAGTFQPWMKMYLLLKKMVIFPLSLGVISISHWQSHRMEIHRSLQENVTAALKFDSAFLGTEPPKVHHLRMVSTHRCHGDGNDETLGRDRLVLWDFGAADGWLEAVVELQGEFWCFLIFLFVWNVAEVLMGLRKPYFGDWEDA